MKIPAYGEESMKRATKALTLLSLGGLCLSIIFVLRMQQIYQEDPSINPTIEMKKMLYLCFTFCPMAKYRVKSNHHLHNNPNLKSHYMLLLKFS